MVPDLDIVDPIKASSMAVFDGSLLQKRQTFSDHTVIVDNFAKM